MFDICTFGVTESTVLLHIAARFSYSPFSNFPNSNPGKYSVIFIQSLLIMIFPFSVCFNRSLKTIITPDNKEQILQYIEKSILRDKADNVVLEGMCVNYKGSTSYWRGSLFGSVDNGVFNLVYKNNSWFLIYQIDMRKLFIGTTILSVIMGVFALANSGPWWIGIAAFLWLCGANWIINFIRHGAVATI